MMELTSPVGKDLALPLVRGREELGRPSEFESRVSTRTISSRVTLLGKKITVSWSE